MKIIVAPDSFKGSLTAKEAARAMERGVRAALPGAEVDVIPMADGGEGTLDALLAVSNGRPVRAECVDPLGRPMTGRYGMCGIGGRGECFIHGRIPTVTRCDGGGKTAVIETATASGLLLLSKEERDPWHTTTCGTGLLIRHALEAGCREFIIGAGGSATNDGGTGMAQAMGVRFYDSKKKEIRDSMCGRFLGEVGGIDMESLHPAVHESRIMAACDVKNPLLGKRGCARVYAGQKGASPGTIERLEQGMASFIGIAEKAAGCSVRHKPGAGAAGGLGAGLALFLGAELVSGVELIMDACRFEERIQGADLILTGEGKIDVQTASGKALAGIAAAARFRCIPVIAFAGSVENKEDAAGVGITKIFTIRPETMPVERAMASAAQLLENAVKRALSQGMRN